MVENCVFWYILENEKVIQVYVLNFCIYLYNKCSRQYMSRYNSSSREVKAGIPCSIGAGRRGFDPSKPPTHEACLLSAVGDLKRSLVP